jgi:hypothetical protein
MDKHYIEYQLTSRINVLNERYFNYCNGVDETGRELSYGTAANYRAAALKDSDLCKLVMELITKAPQNIELSDEAERGLEKLMEPLERHKRLK